MSCPPKNLLIVLMVGLVVACAGTPPSEPIQNPPTFGPLVLPQSGDRPLLAYALGSGAARGFAHVGVLNALERAGIQPDIIVGTSSGGLIGALYAAGIRGDELIELALDVERNEVIDYTATKRGFITGESLQMFVNENVGNRLLQELDIPLAVVATNLRSGQKTVFTHGDSGLAIRAASSFPGLFRPTVIGNREFVDGGVLSPVPVETAFDLGADMVIAVDVAKPPSNQSEIDGWIDVLHQSYLIMARALSATEVDKADIVIRPDIGDMSLLEFDQREMAISAGERAAEQAIPLILEIIRQKSRQQGLATQ